MNEDLRRVLVVRPKLGLSLEPYVIIIGIACRNVITTHTRE